MKIRPILSNIVWKGGAYFRGAYGNCSHYTCWEAPKQLASSVVLGQPHVSSHSTCVGWPMSYYSNFLCKCLQTQLMMGQTKSSLKQCTLDTSLVPTPPSQWETVWRTKWNFWGLFPRSDKDQWDYEIITTSLTTVKFPSCPFEYPYLFWAALPQKELNVARLHCRKSVR